MFRLKCWPFLLNLMLVGCTVGPTYKTPDMPIPCSWHSDIASDICTNSCDNFVWWESLQDPQLNALIECAASQNLDLHIAATRVLLARSEKQARKADYYPHIDGSANYDHVYYSKDALVNGLLGTASPVRHHHVKRNVDFFELGFDADWEIDLFGMTAHELKALKAKEEASKESLRDVWITLSAEVAKNYIELRAAQNRLEILQRNIKTQNEIIQLTEQLQSRGIKSTVDVSLAEEEFALLLSQEPFIELGIRKSIYRISILLGYAPGDLYDELIVAGNIPTIIEEKPIGIPSDLLRRRPDIRKAERQLAAATEKVGSAIAALFPRFSLRGFVGDISTHVGSIFSPASATWVAGPQLLLPIFNSKLLVQDVNYNKILTRQALYEYQKTILESLEEAESAIATYHAGIERNKRLVISSHASQNTLELTKELFERGLKDKIDVLVAAKGTLIAEERSLQSRIDLLLHFISLYKALGGGWEV